MHFDPRHSNSNHGNGINNGQESDHNKGEDSTSELKGRVVEITDCHSLTLPTEYETH